MDNSNIAVIILAGGKGTRMDSPLPKVLHEIGGKPMIQYTLDNLNQMGFGQIIIVVGFGADQVQNKLGNKYTYALQFEQMGTADAVSTGLQKVNPEIEKVLVFYGDDSGFFRPETIKKYLMYQENSENVASIITLDRPQTDRLGRVMRNSNDEFEFTMEADEYEKSGKKTDEINAGGFLFNLDWLRKNIGKIDNNNDRKEYRITEALNLAHKEGLKVGLFKLEDPKEWVGVNTKEDLQKANELRTIN